MAAVYAQHPQQPSYGKQRGYRLCDTCGAVESPNVPRFRLCGGCMITQYCSPDCQKTHWPSHKALCMHTQKSVAASNAQAPSTDFPSENVAKYLRKFCSNYSHLLSWAGYQALQLKRIPSNIRQHALLVEVAADSSRRLGVSRVTIVPRTYVTSQDQLVAADITRREERCRKSGGIGTLVVLVQCAGISQVMPIEVDHPSSIDWPIREDWESLMTGFVATGRVDFNPFSLPPRRY